MRFEKLSDDKIRIILSREDLKKKDIDFHSFMSNSMESQDLFFDMLEEAEKEIGFNTKNYLICIEALAMASGDFVLTVTRSSPHSVSSKPTISNRKIRVKRKLPNISDMQVIYLFSSFDDFCSFSQFYRSNFNTSNFAKKILLYQYKEQYYLVIKNINSSFAQLKKLFSCITEFATPVSNSGIFERKLCENGKLIMKHNAISTGVKFFT